MTRWGSSCSGPSLSTATMDCAPSIVSPTASAGARCLLVSVDQLAYATLGEHPPAPWSKQVQICIARLRKLLGRGQRQTQRRVDTASRCRATTWTSTSSSSWSSVAGC